jgi:hypothetical protein
MFACMRLRWERSHVGMCRGFSVEGHELAQVAHVYGPDGRDNGWIVLLTLQRGELFDHYPTPEEAMAAAEVALDIS